MAYDWLGLDSKLARGQSIAAASEAMGIPLSDAEKYAEKQLKKTSLDDLALHKSAEQALKIGLEQLQRIAQAGPLETKFEEEEIDRETGYRSKNQKTISPTDLKAAEALLKFALDVRKLIGVAPVSKIEVKGNRQNDLFDIEINGKRDRMQAGPWNLKIVK